MTLTATNGQPTGFNVNREMTNTIWMLQYAFELSFCMDVGSDEMIRARFVKVKDGRHVVEKTGSL